MNNLIITQFGGNYKNYQKLITCSQTKSKLQYCHLAVKHQLNSARFKRTAPHCTDCSTLNESKVEITASYKAVQKKKTVFAPYITPESRQ